MTEIDTFRPVRDRLDQIKCSSDGIYVSGHNVRAGLAYAMGTMGSGAIGETQGIIRLAAVGKTLEVQSRATLSGPCQNALTHAWSVAVIADVTRHVDFKVIPAVSRKGGHTDD